MPVADCAFERGDRPGRLLELPERQGCLRPNPEGVRGAEKSEEVVLSAVLIEWAVVLGKRHDLGTGCGGCDCWPRCPSGAPWNRQIETIQIKRGDAVTDNAEAYYLMKQKGIAGVHLTTTINAIHFIWKTSRVESTKRLAILQAASWMPIPPTTVIRTR